MSDKSLIKAVIALGYFDSVHKGHQKVIATAKNLAEQKGAKLVVFTFEGNLKAKLGDNCQKVVYTTEERESLYRAIGADEIFFAPTGGGFLNKEKQEFLDYINEIFQIVGYVSGEDYRFGKGGSGSAKDIEKYAKERGQEYISVKLEKDSDEKISTTRVKELLSRGEVDTAKSLMGRAYSVSGLVFADRKVGRTIGFPTVNIKLDGRKHRLKDGVYLGHLILDGKKYSAIVNYGARPTFDLNEKLVEAHIIGFSGDLYGQSLTVYFDKFLRDIFKFANEQQLINQLKKDLEKAGEMNYD